MAKEDSTILNDGAWKALVHYAQAGSGATFKLEKNFTTLSTSNSLLKIMPLGDSITAGVAGKDNRESGGYRTELWNQFIAEGLPVKFVGSMSSGPISLEEKDHEGHPGWRIRQIARSVDEWLQLFQPDVILLMIGTNDTKKNSLKTMVDELSNLIDQIMTILPAAQLLVASIPPIHPAAKRLTRVLRAIYFNEAIPGIVNAKVAQGKKVGFVDMRSLTVDDLTSSVSLYTDNGLHPNAQGYQKIASFWYAAVLDLICNQQMPAGSR